ncbi:MAG TPA: hypothetical protein VL283_03855 [Candidatus Baltobacteraceae bacterium]|jgi:hypothetical protein|nr:hypothetical protein [Candidatus Baltobacteraceae bacterium]
MHDSRNIRQETLRALLSSVTDPRRLGGHTRAIRIVARFTGIDIKSFGELQALFSSMLEEEAASLLADLRARMPDLTTNTVFATVLPMLKAA